MYTDAGVTLSPALPGSLTREGRQGPARPSPWSWYHKGVTFQAPLVTTCRPEGDWKLSKEVLRAPGVGGGVRGGGESLWPRNATGGGAGDCLAVHGFTLLLLIPLGTKL